MTGSGSRRIAITVIPRFARKPASARLFPIHRLLSGTGVHSIEQLAERHLELLHDLGPLVGPAEDSAELPRLVVVERDHRPRLVVGAAPEVVELSLPVVVEDHREAGPSPVRIVNFVPIPGRRVSSS